MRLAARWTTWLPLCLGAGLLVWLLHGMEFRPAWEAVSRIGWRIVVLVPVTLLWLIPNTIAWGYAFRAPGAAVPFLRLLAARIAGESVNDLLPSGNLGGEPVKAMLLLPEVALAESLSSVTVAKTTQTLALGIFILGGVALASRHAELPPGLAAAAGGAAAVLGGGAAALVLGSSSGLLGGLAKRALRRWPGSGRLASLLGPVVAMDGCLSDFYRRHKSRFLLSTLWHLAGMILGAVELLVIAQLLGLALDVRGAVIMEAVATLAAASSFMIPGSLGAFEFGHYMAASMLGLPPAAGVLISLVRRSRELFWLLAGMLILHRLQPAASGEKTAIPVLSQGKLMSANAFGRWLLKRLTKRKMDRFYAKREDPYRFRSSRFNQERFEAMVACLGDGRPSRALEIGASQGDFTERLAPRVARLTAMEVSEVATRRAQDRLAALRNVDWVCDDIRSWEPPEPGFDLIVLAEVLYYLDKPFSRGEFERLFPRIVGWMSPGGRLVLVHGFVGAPQRLIRLGYRERFERLGLKLVSEQLIAIDPAEEPVQSLVSLLELPLRT